MIVTPLRIRIPPRTKEEEDGLEFTVFGDLCMYLKPKDCLGCSPDSPPINKCSLCLALDAHKPNIDEDYIDKCKMYFDYWKYILQIRKKNY
jgi:hypothetical protein